MAQVLTALLYNATVKPKIAPTNAPDAISTQEYFPRPAFVPSEAAFICTAYAAQALPATHSSSAQAVRAWDKSRMPHSDLLALSEAIWRRTDPLLAIWT